MSGLNDNNVSEDFDLNLNLSELDDEVKTNTTKTHTVKETAQIKETARIITIDLTDSSKPVYTLTGRWNGRYLKLAHRLLDKAYKTWRKSTIRAERQSKRKEGK